MKYKILTKTPVIEMSEFFNGSKKTLDDLINWFKEKDPRDIKTIRKIYLTTIRFYRINHLDDKDKLNTFIEWMINRSGLPYDFNEKLTKIKLDNNLKKSTQIMLLDSYLKHNFINNDLVMNRKQYRYIYRYFISNNLNYKDYLNELSPIQKTAKEFAGDTKLAIMDWYRENKTYAEFKKNNKTNEYDDLLNITYAIAIKKIISDNDIEQTLKKLNSSKLKRNGSSILLSELVQRLEIDYPREGWLNILGLEAKDNYLAKSWSTCKKQKEILDYLVNNLTEANKDNTLNFLIKLKDVKLNFDERLEMCRTLCKYEFTDKNYRNIISMFLPEKQNLVDLIPELNMSYIKTLLGETYLTKTEFNSFNSL